MMQRQQLVQYSNQKRNYNQASVSSNVSSVSSLPNGWRRDESLKQSGLSSGKTEILYISPDGKKIRSKQELQMFLGNKYDLSGFDWRSGRFSSHPYSRPDGRKSDMFVGAGADSGGANKAGLGAASKLVDASIKLPTRQTASIFKRSVTVLRREEASKRSDVKHGPQEPPRQLFWEKRLAGLGACDPDTGERRRQMLPPKGIQGAGGPGLTADQMLHSVVHALHQRSSGVASGAGAGAVTGQQQAKNAFDKNASVAINCEQPLVRNLLISDDDVRRQEARVEDARRKLKMAMEAFHVRPSIRDG